MKLFYRRTRGKCFDWAVFDQDPDVLGKPEIGYVRRVASGPHAGNWQGFDREGNATNPAVSWSTRADSAESVWRHVHCL